ncbi:MAG: SpoIID/LytB domain-containing protein [Paludibacteraceae bacterium]|nr:SpoIID/LytB domain-containing protein [Paludibacteraceae bacterium]
MDKLGMLSVGIMQARTVRFVLDGDYVLCATEEGKQRGEFLTEGKHYSGEQEVHVESGKLVFDGRCFKDILFTGGKNFTLCGVTIGVNFHWQREENQTFMGDLLLVVGNDRVLAGACERFAGEEMGESVVAINRLDVEDYLASVISSEMSATSSLELLKAHAVISRSWLLHPILNPHKRSEHTENKEISADGEERIIRWYERDAHNLFDVCADDHCQRYQGITRKTSVDVQRAIDATRGEVLISEENGEICDARFYKSCGGMTEEFENCWADEHYSYLESVRDSEAHEDIDLRNEQQAERWIRTSPPAYCNTHDKRVLRQVLNGYDQETKDFYRWKVEYSQEELSTLVKEKSGIDFGKIEDLVPIKRGPSGRIYELRIVGEKCTVVVGKELEIRKWLSKSHLYSSAFVVDKLTTAEGVRFVLHGAGWGHGVGLCQIGAAVMADEGFRYEEILHKYFPHTRKVKIES